LFPVAGAQITSPSPEQRSADAAAPEANKAATLRTAAATMAQAADLRVQGKYADAARLYRKVADAGDAKGMYELAMLIVDYGDKFGAKPDDAWPWLEKSADAGNIPAMMRLAVRAESATPARGDEAIAWYAKAAGAGSAGAMRNLGRIHRDGVLVTADAKTAIAWYAKAAARDGRGLARIGDIYAAGKIVPQDAAKAASWYRRAADAGDPEGMYDLAKALMTGAGVAKDSAEAERWLVRAAEAGSGAADQTLLNLGIEREPRAMRRKLPEVNFEQIGFGDVMDFFADASGANIDVDWPALAGAGIKRDTPVTLHLGNVALKDALAQAAAAAGKGKITLGVVGGEVVISTAAGKRSMAAMRARHRAKTLSPQFLARMQRPLPEVKFEGVALRKALDVLAETSGLKIELPADVLKAAKLTPDTPVTSRSRNMRFDVALEQILHSAGGNPPLDYNEHDDRITITTAPPTGGE
jgi:TPR repeat protein